MKFLTDFADQAVVLPVAFAVFVGLLIVGWRRGALAWALAVGGTLAVVLTLKLIIFGCGQTLGLTGGWLPVRSPSGHTAAAAVTYGGLFALLLPASIFGTSIAAAIGGLVALVFGLTRLALHVHTVGDVLLGAAVGVTGALLMRSFAGPRPPSLSSPLLAILACLVMLLFHGYRLDAETRLHVWALDFWPLDRCR